MPDCGGEPYGIAGVEFAAANTLAVPADSRRGERLIVWVREGTADRHPLGDASVAAFISGGGADSGQLARGRFTAADGGAMLDSLAPRRYELVIRRLGYDPYRQRVLIRAGFIDTVTISLRAAPVCLSE